MQSPGGFQQYSYSGRDPSLAFDVVYGGYFEHRLLSARHSNMAHQRLVLGGAVLETGSYDFPVVACGVMPKEALCIGLVAEGAEVTRYNATSVEDDEIQLYPSAAELLYQASGGSRWITFILPEHLLQASSMARWGRPLEIPRQHATSVRLPRGGRNQLIQLADDALALGRAFETTGFSDSLATGIVHGLIDGYVDALGHSLEIDRTRMLSAQRHLHLILACERLALTEDLMNVQLDAIAARSGYSRRALELIFNRTTGMPPGRWFMNVRLNGALRDLLQGAPGCNISDVASRWGFRHFSRFAYQYHRAFGELPSETLRHQF
ncbi:helix-turn-helix transcriptional regulator [Pseudomonas asiatica]|uniref:helix-turn-helix transcriptional regulator n=1 Tax=Pseudomonas asiatica TaxID=2219225 RepID=UPI002E7B6802|nr:helix-turn-helix transcriptional regulator [Pseudomonas asiatica]MEE1919127.1 helix-turn-helix transcriptional regulator [Pseudomonas asiatica]